MSEIYEHMLELFEAFLRGDNAVEKRIEVCDGEVSIQKEGIVFTLPALADFLSNGTVVDYKAFRKSVFSKPTNHSLKKLGGRVVLLESNGKVDGNVYRLERIEEKAD